MTDIRSQQEGKTLMKNETHFPLITEQPSNFAPGIAIFCFLPRVSLLRINSTYRVLVHWLQIVKCKGFFYVEMYLVNAQLKILCNNSLFLWSDLLDFTPPIWLIRHALCWLTSASL